MLRLVVPNKQVAKGKDSRLRPGVVFGFQLLALAMFANVFAIREGLPPEDSQLNSIGFSAAV
jgi:hypothetical protein